MKIGRGKCVYSGEIRQGQRYYVLKNAIALYNTRVATVHMSSRVFSVHHHAFLFRYGHGRCVYDDGRVFVGEWRGDEWYGYGSLYMPDGCAVVNAHWIAHERASPPH
jgi:hypothetical protein